MLLGQSSRTRKARRLTEIAHAILEAGHPARAQRLRGRALRYLTDGDTPWRAPDGAGGRTGPVGQTVARWVRAHRRGLTFAALGAALALAGLVATVPAARAAFFPRNLAAGKAWRITSAYDGWTDKGILPDGPLPSLLFHSREETFPTVTVDLGESHLLRRVRIKNRLDCCGERALPLAVEVSPNGAAWTRVAYRRGGFVTWEASFPPTTGRYVRLRVDRPSILHLAELAIY